MILFLTKNMAPHLEVAQDFSVEVPAQTGETAERGGEAGAAGGHLDCYR